MKRSKNLYFLQLFLFFTFCVSSHLSWSQTKNENFLMPDLSTDQKKLDWLLQVQKTVPGLFSDAARFDIDLMELLDSQRYLQTLLLEKPNYLQAMKEKHPSWLNIEIAPTSNQTVKSFRISPEAVNKWKSSLKESLDSLPKEKSVAENVFGEITEHTSFLKNRTGQGLITGLIMSLPEADRKLVFAAPIDVKLKLLSQKLPSKLSSAFKSEQYGLPMNSSKESAFELLEKIQKSETRLKKLTELSFVLQDGNGVIKGDGLSQLESLGPEDLDSIKDPDYLKPRLKALSEHLNKEKVPLNKSVLDQVKKNIESFASQVETTDEVLGKGIRLDEMPPAIGIFRGCTGGDCSTSMSFPYPNSPNERVFYIYDSEGSLKGYVTGSHVDVKGKPSFRVITIAGPRVSTGDAEMIFEGLNKIKSNLKVEHIVLPSKESLSSLINFSPIMAAYENASGSGALVPIKYTDSDIRDIIENLESGFNTGPYDKMQNNTSGIIYKEKKNLPISVKIFEKKKSFQEIPDLEKKQLSYLFIADLVGSGRSGQVEGIANAAGIKTKDLKEFSKIIANEEKLPLDKFKEKIKSFLSFSEIEYQEKMPSFFEGMLKSPDASEMQDARFINFLKDGFKKNPEKFVHVISASPSLVRSLVLTSAKDVESFGEYTTNDRLKNIINNEDKLSVEAYKTRLKSFFNLTDSELKTKYPNFFLGFTNSPDLIVLDKDPLYVNYVKGKIDKQEWHFVKTPGPVNETLKEYPLRKITLYGDIFGNSPVAKHFIKEIKDFYQTNKNSYASLHEINKIFLNTHITGDLLDEVLEYASSEHGLDRNFAEKFYENPSSVKHEEILKQSIKSSSSEYLYHVAKAFKHPHTHTFKNSMWEIIEKNNSSATSEILGNVSDLDEEMLKWIVKHGDEAIRKDVIANYKYLNTKNKKEMVLEILSIKNDKYISSLSLDPSALEEKEFMDIFAQKASPQQLEVFMSFGVNSLEKNKETSLLLSLMDKLDEKKFEKFVASFKFYPSFWIDDVTKFILTRMNNKNKIALGRFIFSQKRSESLLDSLIYLIINNDVKSLQRLKLEESPWWAENKAIMDSITIKDPKERITFLKKNFPTNLTLKSLNVTSEVVQLEPKINERKLSRIKKSDPSFKEISAELSEGDYVKTKNGKVLKVISFLDEGKRGRVFRVSDESGAHFALKVAKDADPETLKSMSKEATKASLYEKYKIPHAKIHESNSTYALKDLVDGTRADEFVKNWQASGSPEDAPEMKDLKKLIKNTAKSGAYVGDLNPKNLIWDGKKWIVIDSGGISEGITKAESLERFMENIPRRWSKQEGDVCPALFKSLVKSLN